MIKRKIKSHVAKHKISIYTIIISALIIVVINTCSGFAIAATPVTQPGGINNTGPSVPPVQPGGINNVHQVQTLQNPLKVDSIGAAVNAALDIFSYVAVLVGVLMLIWTGLQFILAQGNSAKIKDLKNWLLYIVIGIALVIGARIIIKVVINTLEATGTVDSGVINSANNALKGN